ncbi:MAG: VCBS repeat-containing protein, partial [Pseudomonadota bacterium]
MFAVGCDSGSGREDADAGEIMDDAEDAIGDTGADLEDSGDDADAGDDPAQDPDEEEYIPVCNEGTSWTPGTAAFRDVTWQWGLLGVVGVYLNTADIDGDGWPDLLVRNGGGPDDFSAGGERSRWVLRNTGAGGFEDVTRSSGLLAGRVNEDPDFGRNAQLFAAGDVNNDGILDVFTGISRIDYLDGSTETSEIMLGSGDGTFTPGPADSAARFADKSSNPVGASFVDFDLDGNLSSILEPRHPPFPSIAFQKAYFFFLSGKK